MGKFARVTASLLDKIWLLDWKVTHEKISNNHSCGFPQKVKSRHEMYQKSQLWKLQKSQMKCYISSRHISSPQDTMPQYEISHWKCYIPEIHHSEKHWQRFLGISRKLRFGFNSHFYRGIWVLRYGRFWGSQCSIFSGICHIRNGSLSHLSQYIVCNAISTKQLHMRNLMEILENMLLDIEHKLLIGDFLKILGCLLETFCRYWRITASMRGIGDMGA